MKKHEAKDSAANDQIALVKQQLQELTDECKSNHDEVLGAIFELYRSLEAILGEGDLQ